MRDLIFVLLLSLSFASVACKSSGGENENENEIYRIAVIPKSVGFDFWSRVKTGADEAARELGNIEVIWKGMTDETDIAGQVALVESFITQQIDAIVIAPADARGLVPVLREARSAGIPIVTIDSGTDPQIAASHVATDNVAAAAKAADLVAGLLHETGTVALIPYIAGASTSNEREQGFKEGLKKYPGLDLVAVQYSNSDYGRAMSVTEDILTAHPDLDGVFAANEPSVLGVVRAVKSRGLQGQVKIVGFDASPRQLEGIQDGSIHGLIVQSPFTMGYEGVKQAAELIGGHDVPARIDTGSVVVTRENIDEFMTDSE